MFIKSMEAVLTLLALISVGWILSKKNWIENQEKTFLNNLIVKVCIPALTISNLFSSFTREFIISSLGYLGIIAIFFILIIIIVRTIIWAFKIDKGIVGSFTAMSIVSNSMFFGLPINLSLYGEESLQYVLCYFMVNTAIFWSMCVPMIKKEGNVESQDSLISTIKNVFNVPFVTIIISSILIYNNIGLPSLVLKVSDYFSSMVTPLACIVIGKIIYDIDFKSFRIDLSRIIVIGIRFLIAPILMFTISILFGMPILATKVLTIMASMPIMMQVAIITDMYGGDSEYVTSGIAITTMLTLIVTPIYSIAMDLIL